jgi:ribulokinase
MFKTRTYRIESSKKERGELNMPNKKYSLGIDYGTQSGRAVLVEVDTGIIAATAVKEYTHGVMDEYLPDGKTKLEHDWALEHPADYLEVLKATVPAVLKEAGVSPEDVIGMAVDFTACTMLPIKADGTPLCFLEEFKSNPHAYVKLWKHHAAQPEANKLNEIAASMGQTFLSRYGGKISSEWLIPKIMQILDEAPEITRRQTSSSKRPTGSRSSLPEMREGTAARRATRLFGANEKDIRRRSSSKLLIQGLKTWSMKS